MSTRNKSITFVQIICSLLIVNYHTGILDIPYLNILAKGGFILNSIFVFLSGYLLSLSFSKTKNADFFVFIVKRIKRIYPPFLLVLILTLFYSLLTSKEVILSSYLKWMSGFGYFFGESEIFSSSHFWFVSVILVCYVLFIPSYRILKRIPYAYIGFISIGMVLSQYLLDDNTLNIYSNVSSNKVVRFGYHYWVFIIAIYMQQIDVKIKHRSYIYFVGFILSFFLYQFFTKSIDYSIIAVISAIPVVIFSIPLIYQASSIAEQKFNLIFKLESIPYELYLIHYLVINSLKEHLYGTSVSYFLAFVISILLALGINLASNKMMSLR
ncbi:acyltransferase family protein [Neolewinella antarctica]|uniref:Peptidoglycan/LPS O-acetylase OafA/YrhL n=1 Tax=Neolewinella antarctica TaxID=442734 RepID=A0ABX0XA02_9BACT|nr:peptidoglycan/LPS O-acetylase OafA/YrhL [Neolewinella antarctica]